MYAVNLSLGSLAHLLAVSSSMPKKVVEVDGLVVFAKAMGTPMSVQMRMNAWRWF